MNHPGLTLWDSTFNDTWPYKERRGDTDTHSRDDVKMEVEIGGNAGFLLRLGKKRTELLWSHQRELALATPCFQTSSL